MSAAEGRIVELGSLLGELDESARAGGGAAPLPLKRSRENQLVQVRLGIASSLFRALRWKHEPTARHCLRVTLGCSAWAERMGLADTERDQIELAALLHDVGKVGVPDHILTKPGPLTPQETAVMDAHWLMGLEILRNASTSPDVLAIVASARAWYDGSKGDGRLVGDALPLGARMLSIVDAFDAMLTDQVYRRALSRERALNELYRCAGTQFDPALVKRFDEHNQCDRARFEEAVAQRWLDALDPDAVNAHWRLNEAPVRAGPLHPTSLFEQKLLANMYDAVVFVDHSLRVMLWNRGAERLTGLSESSVYHRRWLPSLLEMRDGDGQVVRDEDCPVAFAIRTGVQWLRRFLIRGRGGRDVAANVHAVPVVAGDGVLHGLAILLHDVSPEISLEERCASLHELATKDPLTQVANRAEFDRVHPQFIAAHLESRLPCSLIMSDIDHFKLVNDTFGHQAGDEVIQHFAKMLTSSCRPGDLVARYGGEEFVVLCADCDNGTAVRRAEELRRAFRESPFPGLSGKPVTASFGVTEVQPGDTAETMLRRSDRALLGAKESGRDAVAQLGIGADPAADDRFGRRSDQPSSGDAALFERELVSEAPMNVCIEKLRGFVADHHAEIVSVEGSQVRLRIGGEGGLLLRRSADRPLSMDLRFEEERRPAKRPDGGRGAGPIQTRIHVVVGPQRDRDRRREQSLERARELVLSLRAYLMASDTQEDAVTVVPARTLG